MLEDLKNKWNAVRSVVSKSQNKLDEALLTSGRVSDALQSLLEWLQKAEAALDEEAPILGDLDTVHMLIEQHRNIQQELGAREATVLTMKAPGNLPAQQAAELSKIWDRVNHLCDIREVKLKEALKLAEEFQDVVTVMREFLPQAEAQLKFRALPEDEMVIRQLIEKHEKFQDDLRNHQESVDKIKGLAEEILLSCHPNAVRFVKYYLTITQTRWDQLLQRASNRGQRLQEALHNIQGNAALLEELLAWLTDAQALLATKERDPIPDDLKVVETLLKEHLEFHDEVTSKNNDAERLSKLVTSESKMAAQGKGYGSNMKLNEFDGYNPRVIALQNKWRTVWHMSVDRKKRLQDAHDNLLELESFKNFDFDLWRQRYLNWIQAKKFRITDFFRRQDKDSDGFLDREEFVGGMLKSKFPSNRTELNAVFDIFDRANRGVIEYKNFVDALKTDRTSRVKNNNRNAKSDVELIHEEIEKELSSCQCRHAFRAEWIEEGKYRFGEKQKTCLVRFLNHTVMVRVGGGWVTLEEFVELNDPCKAKGRTNFDLRESLVDVSRRGSAGGRTSPFPTGARRRQNDTGYASSNSSGIAQNLEDRFSQSSLLSPTSSTSSMSLLSPIAVAMASQQARNRSSANRYSYHGDLSWEGSQNASGVISPDAQAGGSNDSSLRRSRVTSSMVNLAGPINSPGNYINSQLGRSTDTFGSTGNLNRTKRLSTSSSNITGRKTPTPIGAGGKPRSHIFTPRATTPTVAFGTSIRSRPTTPTFSSPSQPVHQRSGAATPTKGLGSTPTSSAPRQRRLPTTPRTPTTPNQQSSQGFR
ncbi:microtubule-actin cross-linking factor 1, isoforms 6/7-like isoform X2 [Physella acuta]|uniref:microtubule-actin cross-linking factor 1, isoforms 6/7-like isoform X2 n=1 Tax=Physella acuta TaxID=109671 RepID=UPI0027DE4169|nr:microtubule-actin cross-linking factor 1, isoforms 6/7-like isoform X2 [Physella acuta]